MIIGTCGFGSSGSSVVSDYLLEFDSFAHMDKIEFTWVYNIDGLIDLESHIMHPHYGVCDSIVAIQRYRDMSRRVMRMYTKSGGINKKLYLNSVEKFLSKIVQIQWKWENLTSISFRELYFKHYFLGNKLLPFLEKIAGKRLNPFFLKNVFVSINAPNFYDAAREHVKELLELLKVDLTKNVVLDQPFFGGNPQASFPFFDDPYAIVVDRDPRDIYIFSKTKLLGRNHYIANDTVYDFVKYYKLLRDNQPYKSKSERVLCVRFEDLVYNYDSETKRIRDFLGLGNNPHPKSIFDPSLSIANTQVFKRFPEFDSDVKYIEEQLAEYLFDFSKYPAPDKNTKMFYGKSPLNKKK